MTKKAYFLSALTTVGCAAALTLTSCQGKASSSATVPTTTNQGGTTEVVLPVAYVRMDSVLSQYKYAQDVQTTLEKESQAHRTRLQGRAAALQKAAEDFQRRAQINAFVSQEAAQKEQNKVMNLQQEVQNLELQLTQQFAMKQQLMQEDILKEIQAQIKEYNKDGKYKLILTNAGVLFADEAMDITAGFIEHLNTAYNPDALKTSADSTKTKTNQ